MSVCDLFPGQKAFIQEIHGDLRLAKRLLAVGCTEGAEISLKSVAPLGDPIILTVRGFNLALRKKDARHIQVKKV